MFIFSVTLAAFQGLNNRYAGVCTFSAVSDSLQPR